MVRYKELYYSWLLSYMQKTLSFGQYQATNGRARRVFISSAGRWEWRDGALIAGFFSTHVMVLLQSDDAAAPPCCEKKCNCCCWFLPNQNVWFFNNAPEWLIPQLSMFFPNLTVFEIYEIACVNPLSNVSPSFNPFVSQEEVEAQVRQCKSAGI